MHSTTHVFAFNFVLNGPENCGIKFIYDALQTKQQ